MNCPMRLSFYSLFTACCMCCWLSARADISDITRIYHMQPALDGFDVCWGGGCAARATVSLTPAEWHNVEMLFLNIHNAERERQMIAKAIGILEDIVGTKTGTSSDRAGTFNNSDYPNQLDCNDEAINSTTYMRLMKQHGLIRFHEVLDTRTRKFFFTGWPHTTAVIQDTTNQTLFAVDAWFYDNGEPAVIIPFAQWKEGWKPQASRAE